jgi:multiple sugar transport system permease protein
MEQAKPLAGRVAFNDRLSLWQNRNVKYFLILPAILLMLGFAIFPLVYSLGLSVTGWTVQNPDAPFLGLENYRQVLLEDGRWQQAMVRTLALTAVAVTIELALGFLIAHLLIDELPGKRLIIPLLVLPAVTNPIVVGFTWRVIYNPSYGPINQIIGALIGQPFEQLWLSNQGMVLVAVTIVEIWQWTPFMFLVMLAGLTGINPEYYEAASIDGASRWNILLRVTIPLMRPIIVIAVLLRGLDIIKLFDLIYVMTGGGPGTASETVSHYIYVLGFEFFRMGYGAAAAYLLLIVLSVLVALLLRRLSKEEV